MTDLISSTFSTIQGTTQILANKSTTLLNKILPPSQRAHLWAQIQTFINEKPVLASFLLSQIAISGPALALFITLTITVALFSLITGLLIGLLGAVLFIVAAIGFALIFVLPTLFFTTMLATFVWLWGMGVYYIVKNFNQGTIPGLNTDVKTALLGDGKASGNDSKSAATASDHQMGEKQWKSQPPKLERRSHENGYAERESKDSPLVF